MVPAYPYGPNLWYKQSNKGLYGGAKIQYGNNISEKSETKTRRKWRLNVQDKKLWSNALGKHIDIKVTTRVLRTIDKCGGVDEFLVGSQSAARIKELGIMGWTLRCRIMGTEWWKERAKQERIKLGLDKPTDFVKEIKKTLDDVVKEPKTANWTRFWNPLKRGIWKGVSQAEWIPWDRRRKFWRKLMIRGVIKKTEAEWKQMSLRNRLGKVSSRKLRNQEKRESAELDLAIFQPVPMVSEARAMA